MNEIRISDSEILDLQIMSTLDNSVAILLKSKGLPLKDNFLPKLRDDYEYFVSRDYEKFETIYQYRAK